MDNRSLNISISEVQLDLLEVCIEVHQEAVLAVLESLSRGGPLWGLEVEARRSEFDLFLYVNPHLSSFKSTRIAIMSFICGLDSMMPLILG